VAERKVPLDHKKTRGSKNEPERKKKVRKTLKIILLSIIAACLIIGGSAMAVLVSYIKETPPFDETKLKTVETSYLFDKNGREITALHGGENREIVLLPEIPKHVQDAFIAMEDERFYSHFGFDMIGIIRAVWVNLRAGGVVQGASTITQQLAQNAFLGKEQKIKRKVHEIWLSLQMERRFSKEEILEMYLNRIYFGNRAYGVEAASQIYFNKSVRDISIAEGAMLAGIVRWPNNYNPHDNEANALDRMKRCLNNMLRIGSITRAEYDAALATEFVYGEPSPLEYAHAYFVDYVIHHELLEILTAKFMSAGLSRDEAKKEAYNAIYSGGLRVYTTMDTEMQAHVEDVLNRAEYYPQTIFVDREKAREAIKNLPAGAESIPAAVMQTLIDEENGVPQPQSALVLSDPKTGEIWALGGGRAYGNNNKLLRFTSERQPGSAIKPLITYAGAFEEGLLGAGSTLDDTPLVFPGPPEPWYPENYDGTFRGMVTVRVGLSQSLNVPAVQAYRALGQQKGAAYARDLGISTFDPAKATLSWTLGAREVTALDMAEAYGVFANNGIRMKLHTVRKIEDRNGNVIYEHTPDPAQVLSPQAVFIMNDILQDVVRYTTARGLQAPRPMAAKTGTTDDYRDAYLVAYTPNAVISTWIGYDERIMGQIAHGWNYSNGITRAVFTELFKKLPVEQFKPQPAGVVKVEVCTKSGLLPTEHCREAGTVQADYFLAKHAPRLTCDMHVVLEICNESGELAGEFCPEDEVVKKAFFNRPEYITTDSRWKRGAGRKPADAEEMPPEKNCSVHTEDPGKITAFSKGEVTFNSVELIWEYEGETLKEFHLYRRLAGVELEQTPLAVIPRDERIYVDGTVMAGTRYTYTIYAVSNQGGWSKPATVTVDVPTDPRPKKPENFTGELKNGPSIELKWNYVTTIQLKGFIINRGTSPGVYTKQIPINNKNKRDYIDSDGLEPGKTYYYQIVAVNTPDIMSEPAVLEDGITIS
jgi:penicillin-binding protein 1A